MANERDINDLRIIYFQVTDLWRRFCELHTDLLNCTLDEYTLLLSSDIEKLEEKVQEKKRIIEKVTLIEKLRTDLIKKINETMLLDDEKEISQASDLVLFMKNIPEEAQGHHLQKFNDYLIDVINKIQDQNKKNQLFINKAIISLKNIRQGALGQNDYKVYNSKGNETRNVSSRT